MSIFLGSVVSEFSGGSSKNTNDALEIYTPSLLRRYPSDVTLHWIPTQPRGEGKGIIHSVKPGSCSQPIMGISKEIISIFASTVFFFLVFGHKGRFSFYSSWQPHRVDFIKPFFKWDNDAFGELRQHTHSHRWSWWEGAEGQVCLVLLPPALVSTPSQLGQESVGLEEKCCLRCLPPGDSPRGLVTVSSSDFPNYQQPRLSFPPPSSVKSSWNSPSSVHCALCFSTQMSRDWTPPSTWAAGPCCVKKTWKPPLHMNPALDSFPHSRSL